MSDIVWEEPPQARRRNETAGILAVVPRLKERPGAWARVHTGGGSGVTARAKHLKAAGCETATAKSDSEGQRHLFARWPDPEGQTR